MDYKKETMEGTFIFQIENGEVCLVECNVCSAVLLVPIQIEGAPVTKIGKKAFLGQRNLKRAVLPEGIHTIGDWAFAGCRNLEEVEFLGAGAELGKDVFQNCQKLRRIKEKGLPDDISYLLASVPLHMQERYLLNIKEAGSENWLSRWDASLVRRIRESDEEGFADQFMCGLENFGHQDKETYLEERRREKSELSYLRLLHPYGLSDDLKMRIQRYLLRHSKGCVSEASWRVLLENHGTDMNYVNIYRSVFGVEHMTDVAPEQKIFHLDEHLKDIGDDYPELKAYLLKEDEHTEQVSDFFKDLSLDF